MKTLIVFYSRSGITRNIAYKIQKELNCDIEEISDNGKYNGKIGYLKGGFSAVSGRGDDVECVKKPEDYDLIIIGTPVWASNMATPIYSYLSKYNERIKNISCFCTCISGGWEKTFEKASELTGKKLKSQMYLTQKDINNCDEKIKIFIANAER